MLFEYESHISNYVVSAFPIMSLPFELDICQCFQPYDHGILLYEKSHDQ